MKQRKFPMILTATFVVVFIGYRYFFVPMEFPFPVGSCVKDTQLGRIYKITEISSKFFNQVSAIILVSGSSALDSWKPGESINFVPNFGHQQTVLCPN
jgi:hypothetical protein